MTTFSDRIPGTMVGLDGPRWEPLLTVLDEDLAEWFMSMFDVELADGTRLHAYKNSATRRYLHLADDGRAFGWDGDGAYVRVDLVLMIRLVFEGAERYLAATEDPARLHDAIDRACRRADATDDDVTECPGSAPGRRR